jgi:hypothetical protein
MRTRKQRQRGSAMIEFTLVGIPMIFLLISIFEISRAMWNYHTLAFAIREGTSALAMFWPGAGKGITLPTAYLTAGSADIIQF